MRKIFANLKSVVALAVVAAMTLSVSCMYDDTALTKRVDKVEKNLAALTEKVNALGGENASLESLLAGKLVITGVTTDEATGNKVITLSDGSTITVLAECAGLQYRVVDGVLEISADGETWVAVTAAAECVVKEVRTNEDGTATLVLANGTEFTSAVAELIECAATRAQVYVLPEETKAVPFTINDAVEDITVMNQPNGWKASVEAPATRAAGGAEYVLNITGPAKGNVYADKEGVVAVHFNTVAGACKVLKVAVNLAELTLTVENGVVTLTNSVASEQTDRWGNTFTDFADFAIGVMEASAYKQYGDKVFTETYDDLNEEYFANVSFTKRTSGFQNVVDLMYYEDATCEKESYTFSIEELANMFYPIYNFELGGEYIIFVTFDTELVNRFEHPVLANALMVDYKNTVMSANYVSSTSNGANYEFNLAGYSHYILGWVMKQELDMYIGYGVVSSLAEYLSLFAGDMGGVCGLPGTLVAGPLAGTYNLADLAAQSMTGWAPEISADTEYCFYIYPLNIESEMDLYADVDVANVFEFGTFETTGLVPGNFDAIAEYEVSSKTVRSLIVNAYFNEDVEVAKFAYEWFEGPALDEEERIASMLENSVFRTTEYFSFVEAEYYSPVYPAYLGIIVVNAAGEYAYEETVYEYVESYNFEIEFATADFVDGVLKFQGADANDYLDVIVNPGLTSIVAGEYAPVQPDWFNDGIIPWSSADALEFDGSNSKFNLSAVPAANAYYLTEYGKMTVALEGDVYTIVVTDLGYIDGKYQPVKFTFTGQFGAAEEGGEDENENGVNELTSAVATLVTDTTFNGFNPYDVVFTSYTGDVVQLRFATNGSQYLHEGAWQGNFWKEPHYITLTTFNGEDATLTDCNVAYDNDVYTVALSVFEFTNYSTKEYTYTGAIEGLNAPEDCECFKEPELPNTENLTLSLANYDPQSVYCNIAFVDAEGKNAIVLSLNDCPLVDCTYTVETSSAEAEDPGTMYLNDCYVEYGGYKAGSSATLKSGSVDVKANGDGTYTITFDLVLSNGQVYSGVFNGAI